MGEGVSISVRSCEPSDMTEVSVVHTAGTEETAEPSEVMDSSAVEPTENDVKLDQPDTATVAESKLTEESAELVILSVCEILCVCYLHQVCYVFVVVCLFVCSIFAQKLRNRFA